MPIVIPTGSLVVPLDLGPPPETPVTNVTDSLIGEFFPWQAEPGEVPDANLEDLTGFLRAVGSMFAEVEELAADQPDGTPGWSKMLDVDNCPERVLPYLAQWVGERLPAGILEEAARQWIRDAPNQKRATNEGVARAGQRHLTGTKTIMIRNRHKLDGTPNVDWCAVLTLAGETADAAVSERDLLSVMPADIKLDYTTTSSAIWSTVEAGWATWADVYADNPTWADVASAAIHTAGGWLVWTA